jgi:ectoine hydroxylase-related dioxygenase (phytanoyl-CoA dioxygenase family)
MTVTAEQKQQYLNEGYAIFERALPSEHLAILRDECQRYMALMDAEMEAEGVSQKGINHKGSRYFIAAYKKDRNPRLAEVLFSSLFRQLCAALLESTDPRLFVEQFVVKAAEHGAAFSWHQDGGYVGHPHKPYLSCWCPLDDVTIENGTVFLLPYSQAGSRELVPHTKDPATGDKVGYFGAEPGIPVIVPAGSVVCFSSTAFHRSGVNTTDQLRRVYLTQYSDGPLLKADGSGPWNLAEAFPA